MKVSWPDPRRKLGRHKRGVADSMQLRPERATRGSPPGHPPPLLSPEQNTVDRVRAESDLPHPSPNTHPPRTLRSRRVCGFWGPLYPRPLRSLQSDPPSSGKGLAFPQTLMPFTPGAAIDLALQCQGPNPSERNSGKVDWIYSTYSLGIGPRGAVGEF